MLDDNSTALLSVVKAAFVLKSSLGGLAIKGGDAWINCFLVSKLLIDCQNLRIRLQSGGRAAILCVISKLAKNDGSAECVFDMGKESSTRVLAKR